MKANPDFISGAEDLMMDYIEAELRGLKIPTIKGKQAWGVYELQGIETKKFDVKAEKMTVDPSGRYRVMSDCAVREGVSKDSPKVRFLLKNLHFLLKNVDFRLKNVDFIIKRSVSSSRGRLLRCSRPAVDLLTASCASAAGLDG